MNQDDIYVATYKLGRIWGQWPDLTLPQILQAIAGELPEVEILVSRQDGVTTGAELQARPPELDKYTNEEWSAMIQRAFLEVSEM